jgi:HSP90 family molecular chaperone
MAFLAQELTEFDEFHLRSVARHQYEAQAQEQEARRRAEEEEKAAHFHARPVPKTLYEKDFEPVFEERAPLVPVDVSFESDQRAAKRKEFDDAMAAKVAQLEEQKALAARRKAEKAKAKAAAAAAPAPSAAAAFERDCRASDGGAVRRG